jgi:hypothetical protein
MSKSQRGASATPCTTLPAPLHLRHNHPSLCNLCSVCNDFKSTKRYNSCFKLDSVHIHISHKLLLTLCIAYLVSIADINPAVEQQIFKIAILGV